MSKDCWLVLETKEQCEDIIKRISKKDSALCCQIGVPLALKDGRWVQCVNGCSRFFNCERKESGIVLF